MRSIFIRGEAYLTGVGFKVKERKAKYANKGRKEIR